MRKILCLLATIFIATTVFGQSNINDIIIFEYGDGEAEDAFVWSGTGGKCALQFSPMPPWLGYPFKVVGGSVWIDPDFPSGQVLGSSFKIEVYDDDGLDGYPGTLLGSLDCIVDSTGWFEFYGLDIIVNDGVFYIAMVQTDPTPDCASLGIDTSPFAPEEISYVCFPDSTNWELSVYQNWMIKAYVDYSVGIKGNQDTQADLKTYPNPFTTSSTIEYELTEPSHVHLTIYNAIGETIYKVEEGIMPQGKHNIIWSPERLPEGLYYAVLRSEDGIMVVKMIKCTV